MRLLTHIIVSSQKVLLKEFGSYVQLLMREVNQFQKLLNGIENLKKLMLALVKMVKECWALLNAICQKINSQEDSNLITKMPILISRIKHLWASFPLLIHQETLYLLQF
jgi:hypothetical protein